MSEAEQLEKWGLQNPKMVGSSEYHAIYETISDGIFYDDTPEEAADMALAMLNEFIQHAQYMQAVISKATEITA